MTSDEYILLAKERFDIIHIKYKPTETLSDKLTKLSSRISNRALNLFAQKNHDDNMFK